MINELKPEFETSLKEWLNKDQIDEVREQFVGHNAITFISFLGNDNHFSELSPQLIEKAGDLLARFMFGVTITYRRLGFNLPFKILYDERDNLPWKLLGADIESQAFGVNIKGLNKLLINMQEGKSELKGGGFTEAIPIPDLFEIAGVEEAAHLMYGHFKDKREGSSNLDALGDEEYHSTDAEAHALTWKLAYVKRYFPQHYNSLSELVKKVRQIRIENMKKENNTATS